MVGEHAHPVGVQDVERVRDLRQRALDVRQRQRCPEAESVGPSLLQVGGELVALARELARLRVIAVYQVAPWRADAQDRLGNVRLVHELEMCFLGPRLCSQLMPSVWPVVTRERKYEDDGEGRGGASVLQEEAASCQLASPLRPIWVGQRACARRSGQEAFLLGESWKESRRVKDAASKSQYHKHCAIGQRDECHCQSAVVFDRVKEV